MIVQELDTPKKKTIFVDSQAALKAIKNSVVRSKTVRSCREALRATQLHSVRLCWVSAHSGITGNEQADELARHGTQGPDADESSVAIPIRKLYGDIEKIIEKEADSRWGTRNDCVISRILWPDINPKRTREILRFKRASIRSS